MRSTLKFKILTFFCSLILMQVAIFAQTTTKTPEEKTPLSKALRNLEVEFPEIEGWQKDEVVKYPSKALGYSVNYQSREGGRVTVYVYDGGTANIPNDINNSVLKNEINRAKNEIHAVGKAGMYQNVKEVLNDTVNLGGTDGKIKALHSLFNFTARGQDLTSEIFLFPYQNNFIKIRATRLKDKAGIENKALTTLFSEIDTFFSN